MNGRILHLKISDKALSLQNICIASLIYEYVSEGKEMKVCLINPCPIDKNKNDYSSSEHLGLAYIASSLKEDGHIVTLLNCGVNNITMKDVYSSIRTENYDAIGMTYYYGNRVYVSRIASYIKRFNNNIFTFVGGYLPTLESDKLHSDFDFIDCMVIGEGEITAKSIINNLKNGLWKNTPGIIYKQENQVINTGCTSSVDNLDLLPFPLRINSESKRSRIITSRGCRGACVFCCMEEFYKKNKCKRIRRRSPQNVVDEIEELIKSKNTKLITISDDNFPLLTENNKIWLREFCDILSQKSIQMNFSCELRADDIINGIQDLVLFKNHGLKIIFVGIESFLDHHLSFYNKKVDYNKNVKTLYLLDDNDISYSFGYLLFNPTTTIEDIYDTCKSYKNFLYERENKCILNPISYCTVIAYNGTRLKKYIDDNNLLSKDFKQYEIIDKRAERCCQLIQKWKKYISPFYYEKINYYKFYNECEQGTEKNHIELIYNNISILDVEVLEKITSLVVKDNYETSEANEIFESYYEKIKNEYESAASEIKMFL